LDKPIIAAVQGVAAGAGWSLALACDVRVAARSARFVPAFVRLGLVPGMGGSAALVEAVGAARALEYLLYRDELTADAALRFGLVSEVVEDGELAKTVQQWATRVSGLPREGVARTKQLLRGMQEDAFRRQIDRGGLAAAHRDGGSGTPRAGDGVGGSGEGGWRRLYGVRAGRAGHWVDGFIAGAV
jgi:2-(1,2-epoxy-1,2-dihydrophenyl)acetyl-CoA isomerase